MKVEEVNRLMDTFGPEELHDDLKPYVYEDGPFGRSLKHPLVIMTFFDEPMHKMANRSYLAKKASIEQAIEDRKWGSVLALHERPYRWECLMEHVDKMTDEEYWENVSWVWTDSENIWQYWHSIYELMTADRPGRENMMTVEEKKRLASLPDEITIYRGWVYEDAEFGMSWSLDENIAHWFALRFIEIQDDREARVTAAKVEKVNVIAYFNGRNEDEIVIDPDNVYNCKIKLANPKLKRKKISNQDD